MRIAKNPKYEILYGYRCAKGNTVGIAPRQVMARDALSIALAMTDPFHCNKWLADVARLARRGDSCVITTTSESTDYGLVERTIRVTRV